MGASVIAAYEGHAVLGVTGLLDLETRVGYLACLTCAALIRPLRRCGRPTRDGALCRVFVRDDLGHDRCWSHGEGRGRTSTLRQIGRAS